jgi:nucleoside-diphosphate-sugar epimerase
MRILVTGAAGLIGAEVVAQLAEAGHAVIALIHKNAAIVRNDGAHVATVSVDPSEVEAGQVATLSGDIAVDDFGWSESMARRLSDAVDLVVHSAAITRFGLDASVYHALNVGGTRRLLAWLARNPRIGLVHVSTTYVCGERRGRVAECELDRPRAFGNPYEESKYLTEHEVFAAARRGLRAAIVRPGIVVGESTSGKIREFKDIYVAVRMVTSGKVTAIPANYDATLELAPIDHIVAGILQVIDAFDRAVGRAIHLVGGAVTLRHVSDVIAEHPALVAPRYVAPYAFHLERLPDDERQLYHKVLRLYECYFQRQLEFADDALVALGGRRAEVRGIALLRTMFDYAAAAGYLKGPSSSPRRDRANDDAVA